MSEKVQFKMTDLNFRKNVDPDKRRNTNKNLTELNVLKEDYRLRKTESENLEKLLDTEKTKLKVKSTNNKVSFLIRTNIVRKRIRA
jgi:hypothetical protein